MASAEHLLNEAQYAFSSISFGESRDNARNRFRAKSLCKKIIRKYPRSTEATQANDILIRLGDRAYSSKMKLSHQHDPNLNHHEVHTNSPGELSHLMQNAEQASLNWGGLISLIASAPKVVLAPIVLAGLFVFGIFGPFIFIPLIAIVFLTGPFRQLLKSKQRDALNNFIVKANAFIAEKQNA